MRDDLETIALATMFLLLPVAVVMIIMGVIR